MHDGDWETQNVLHEIESYEPLSSASNRPCVRRTPILNSAFQQKLDAVNLEKQMHHNHKKTSKCGWESEKEEITKSDIAKWKEQVLLASRPMNQYSENRQVNIDISALNSRSSQQHPETSHHSIYELNDVHTVSGDNTVFSATNNTRKSTRIPVKVNNQAKKVKPVESDSEKYNLAEDLYHARPCYIVNSDKNDEASSSNQYSFKTGYQIRQFSESRSAPNEKTNGLKQSNFTKNYDIVRNNETSQRQKYEEFVEQVEKDIQANQSLIGLCAVCGGELYERSEVVCALEKIFHNACLVCELCGRTLKGKRFYKIGKKFFCEEDYLYTAIHSTAEKCSSCMEPIISEALQAFGKSYHPQCFRCYNCNKCLDGIPFAVDDRQRIYCTKDYAELFAPRCVQCKKPIHQSDDNGRVTRLIVNGRNYHQDCFVCEGCRCKLAEVGESVCYPLNGHLLCQNCHRIWKSTGGTENVITDL